MLYILFMVVVGDCPESTMCSMVKRSVVIGGHKTSVSLEQPFWDVVREIAATETITVSAVLRRVDAARAQANLSSAVRVYVLQQVRARPIRGDTAPNDAYSSA